MFTNTRALIVPCVLVSPLVSSGSWQVVQPTSTSPQDSMAIIEEVSDEDVQRHQATDPNDEEEEEYDLNAPPVSNFMSGDYETISPRELTFRDAPPGPEMRLSMTTFIAFVMAVSLAHFILVTQGFLGKKGTEKQEAVWNWLEGILTKWSITLPKDWNQPPGQKVEL